MFQRFEQQWHEFERVDDTARFVAPEGFSPKSAPRRRLLVLAPRYPYPVIGGDRIRIHRLARELARYYDLTLLTFCRTRRERNAPPPADGLFREVHRIVMPCWRSWLNALGALPTREPLQVAYYRSAAFRAAVEALAPSHDAVLAHLVRTAEYARHLPTLRMLEMTDAISMNLERVNSLEAGYFDLRQWIYAIEAPRLRDYERNVTKGFDVVTLVSEVDKAYLVADSNAAARVLVVPNGVDSPDALPPPQSVRNPDEIAFVGHLSTLQNYDAVWFFAHNVLPRLRARRPRTVFRIIGPIRPLAARSLSAIPGVRVEGVVPCLSTALATARVGVCPTRAGSGIQNKVLEYFANRLAVVCSPFGAEGIEAARSNEHLLIAATPEEWAAQVSKALDDEILAQRLADAGRALARTHHQWTQRVWPLVNRLDHLLEQQRRVSPAAAGAAVPTLTPVLAKT